MSFIEIVLAICCGRWLYQITFGTLSGVIDYLMDRKETKNKIGFGDDDSSSKKSKGATMRKIGFGEND